MRHAVSAFTAIMGALGLSACAGAPGAETAMTHDPTARAAQALIAGADAFEADDRQGLRAAAGALAGLGAEPADGEADLAQVWSARAEALGAAPIPPRGRTAGPAYRDGVLGGGERAAFRDTFHSGRAAIVSLAPRGEGAFVLWVRDEAGAELCRDVAEDGPVECRWIPVWTAPVRIEVANLSGGPARYFLLTN